MVVVVVVVVVALLLLPLWLVAAAAEAEAEPGLFKGEAVTRLPVMSKRGSGGAPPLRTPT